MAFFYPFYPFYLFYPFEAAKYGGPFASLRMTTFCWRVGWGGLDELLGGLAADADDEVSGGDVAYVADGVGGHGGGEDDAAGADVFGFAVVLEGDGALADQEDVRRAVLVEGVGGGSDGDGGLVDLEVLAGEGGAVGDGAGLAAVGILFDGEISVEEDAGAGEDGVGEGGLGFGTGGQGEGGESGQEIAAVDGDHAGNGRWDDVSVYRGAARRGPHLRIEMWGTRFGGVAFDSVR